MVVTHTQPTPQSRPEPGSDTRIAELIAWLRRNQARLEALDKGRLEVNFAGRSVSVSLTAFESITPR